MDYDNIEDGATFSNEPDNSSKKEPATAEELEMELQKAEAYAKLRSYYISRMKALPVSVLRLSKRLADALSEAGITTIGELTKRTQDEYATFLSSKKGGTLGELSAKIKDIGTFGMTDDDWAKKVEHEERIELRIYFPDIINETFKLDGFDIIRIICIGPIGYNYELTEARDIDGHLRNYFYNHTVAIIREKGTIDWCIHKSFYDATERLVPGPDGWVRFEATFGKNKEILGLAYYDENGSLVVGERGYARSEYTYHSETYIKTRAWYDEHGNLLRKWRGRERMHTPRWWSDSNFSYLDTVHSRL